MAYSLLFYSRRIFRVKAQRRQRFLSFFAALAKLRGIREKFLYPAFGDDVVFVIEDDDFGFMFFELFGVDKRKAHDGETVAAFAKMRRSAVETDSSAAAFGWNGIRFKSFAVGLIACKNFLIRHNPGCIH